MDNLFSSESKSAIKKESQPNQQSQLNLKNVGTQQGQGNVMQEIIGNFTNANITINSNPHGQRENTSDDSRKTEMLFRSLKSKLIGLYERITLPCIHWIAKERSLEMNEFYTNLHIVCEEKHEMKKINLEEIFNRREKENPSRILVEAQPGYGKTTLATKLAYDWAKGKGYVSHFDLAFFIPLRHLRGKTLIETLQELCKGIKLDENVDFIETGHINTLLILDGFDEIHPNSRSDVLKALFKFQFMNVTILLTCRTGVFPIKREEVKELSPLHPSVNTSFQDVKIIINGINEENRVEFLSKFAPDCDPEKTCDLLKDLPSKSKEMFNCPLILLQISHFALTCKMLETKSTLGNFYKSLMNNIVNFNLNREENLKDGEIDLFNLSDKSVSVYQEQMAKFGELCLSQLTEYKYSFDSNNETVNAYKLGLLIKHKTIGFLSTEENFECFHLSIMEFCAAYFVWRKFQITGNSVFAQEKICEKILSLLKRTARIFCVFLSSLFQAQLLEFLQHFEQILPKKIEWDIEIF